MSIPHFLVHSPKDNVCVVVVEGLKSGTEMHGVITETDATLTPTALNNIPIGHKVALSALGHPIVPVVKITANPRTIRTMSEHDEALSQRRRQSSA